MLLYLMLLNRSHYIRDAIVILNLVALLLINFSAIASDPDVPVAGRTTIARQAAEWNSDGKPVKLDFDFGVQHRGLRCTTYTLFLRVGHGNPGCTDVHWFREPVPVASTQVCNNAPAMLSGGNLEFRDAARFDEITCAERIISCSGTCK